MRHLPHAPKPKARKTKFRDWVSARQRFEPKLELPPLRMCHRPERMTAALQKVCWNPVETQDRRDVVNGFRFTEAALRWVETWGVAFSGLKAACKAAGIEAEHTRAVDALSNVDKRIMKLMRVRDEGAMLEEEGRLMAATEKVVKTMEQLSEAAHVRRVDVSATAAIVKSLITVLETRGMLKQ